MSFRGREREHLRHQCGNDDRRVGLRARCRVGSGLHPRQVIAHVIDGLGVFDPELRHHRTVTDTNAKYESIRVKLGKSACGADHCDRLALPDVRDTGADDNLLRDAQEMRREREGIAAERLRKPE